VLRYVGIGLIPLLLIIVLLILWTKTLRKSVEKQTPSLQEKTATLEELNATKNNLFKIDKNQSARGTSNEGGTGLGLI